MARVTGLEPATSCVTGRRSSRLNYTRTVYLLYVTNNYQRATRVELATLGLEGRRSSQLSYTRMIYFYVWLYT